MNTLTAPVSEVFFSSQGEGIYFSQPQIFVRFFGCNLNCGYCDTKSKKYSLYNSKALTSKVLSCYSSNKNKFPIGFPATVAITGGEPLIHADFLKEFIKGLKRRDFAVFLETNGTLSDQLAKVIDKIDVVSMDIKLPSDCGKNFFKNHRKFLKLCKGKAYVKVVVTGNTKLSEISRTLDTVSSASKGIALVFQPVTPSRKVSAVKLKDLNRFCSVAGKKVTKCFLIPQMHKVWNVK